jgi:hypothetical protein
MRLYSESAIFTSRPMDIQLKLAADVGYSTGVQPSRRKSRFFQVYTMTTGILSFPELADGFRRLIQPFPIRQQHDEFDGAEKLHCIRVWTVEWTQLTRSNEQGDILRRAIQQLRHLRSKQPGRQIFRRPRRIAACVMCCLRHVIRRSHLGIGILQGVLTAHAIGSGSMGAGTVGNPKIEPGCIGRHDKLLDPSG